MCPQVPSRKARLDSWGIPIGAGEGVTTSRSEHVAGAASTTHFTCFASTKRTNTDELQRTKASRKYQRQHRERGITGTEGKKRTNTDELQRTTASRKYQRQHRERGITGAQAREALGGYFRQLVAKVTHCTCITGTNVQILTACWQRHTTSASKKEKPSYSSLLALLVQKY
jgi:hypothetical protein